MVENWSRSTLQLFWRSELALHALAFVDVDLRHVGTIKFAAQLGIRDFDDRVFLPLHHLKESESEQREQEPERDVAAQVGPAGARRARRVAFSHLGHIHDAGQVPVLLRMV